MASLTEILDWIEPSHLPAEIQETLTEIGPLLAAGLTYAEIGDVIGRSDDWVGARLVAIRRALVEEALTRADEMGARLRGRLESMRASEQPR